MKLFDDNLAWYKANLHTHTTRSDGKKSPEEVEALYRENGYSILALTDHRKAMPGREDSDFILLSGIEVNPFKFEKHAPEDAMYHIVGVGLDADRYLAPPNDENPKPQDMIDSILNAGGLAILAHPAWSMDPPDQIEKLKGLTAAEVYNSVSGFPWMVERADSSSILDVTASRGTLIPFVASDDAHFYTGEHCRSFTMIQPETFTTNGVLDALRNGKFYASRGPRIKQVEISDGTVRVECSECVRAMFFTDWYASAKQAQSVPEGATSFEYPISKHDHIVRVELWDRDGNRAWTSPTALKTEN